jgi:hypothetical protein
MRCYCCDKILSSVEATRKFSDSGEYTEMCNECLGHISGEVDTEEGVFAHLQIDDEIEDE